MDAAGQRRSDLIDKAIVALAFVPVLAFCVAGASLLITVDAQDTEQLQYHIRAGPASAPQQLRGGDTVIPVAPGGPGGAGAVEEAKGFYAGRPLFKVPPSSSCRAEALRC